MCIELGMHLCFVFARLSSTLRGQVGYISVLPTHGPPSGCLVLCSCEQPREIPVLIPFVVHSLIRQTFKAVFEYPSRRFWRALRPTDSPWGLPLRRRRPPHPVGFGPWLLPQGVKPGPTVGGVYRGPLAFNSSLCRGDIFVRSARHYHSPNIRGVAVRRHPSATLGVSRLSTAGVAA